MSLSRPFGPGEEVRRCSCGHIVIAKATDTCPRCRRPLPVVRAQQGVLIGMAEACSANLARFAGVYGIRGELRVTPGRVLGVLKGDRA